MPLIIALASLLIPERGISRCSLLRNAVVHVHRERSIALNLRTTGESENRYDLLQRNVSLCVLCLLEFLLLLS